MLVGSCMENVLRPVSLENLLHVLLVGNAGNDGLVLDVREPSGHHHPDVVHRGLRLVDQRHLRRAELRYLTYDFGTDGTCRAGDEDTLAAQLLLYLSHIDLNLVARQQVLDVYLMQLSVR